TIEFYVDGDSSNGTPAGSISANLPYFGLGFSGNHGYQFLIPNAFRDGQQHTLYAYAVDTEQQNTRILLSGSPKSFRLYQPNAAARTYYNSTVAPLLRNQCSACHGDSSVFYDYDAVFYLISFPTPANGGTATTNELYVYTSGGNGHG